MPPHPALSPESGGEGKGEGVISGGREIAPAVKFNPGLKTIFSSAVIDSKRFPPSLFLQL